MTEGLYLGMGDVPEELAARLAEVTAREGDQVPGSGSVQGQVEVGKAMKAHGHG
ncbi:hypothetical protein J4714_14280 [Staphylococcus epidermidis]|nr:hypothetical protein [Staphylococcus epidermidis]